MRVSIPALYKWLGWRHPLLILIAALVALYALTYHGFYGSVVDEAMMLGVTGQIVDAHSVQLNPIYPALLYWQPPAADPAQPIYSKYAIGQSLIGLPLYAAGKLIPIQTVAKAPNGAPFLPLIPMGFALMLGILTTVFSALGLFAATRLLGYSARTGALLIILYGVTTLAWPYAKTFYNEPSTACALIWMLYGAIRYRRLGVARDGLLAGVCLGLAILLRTTSLVLVPLLLIYLIPRWRLWLLPLIGIGASFVLTLAYNLVRFGSLTESGYEPGFGRAPWEALLGYVVSPSRSVFLFNPILLLAIPGAFWLANRLRRETLFLLALIILPTLVYAAWWAWDGGASLGPRFFVAVLPVAMLLVAPVIERPRWRPALIMLGLVGFGLQIVCSITSPGDIFQDAFEVKGITPSVLNWQFENSIIANLWAAYLHHPIDSVILRAMPIHDPLLLALLFGAAASLLAGVMLWAALRVRPPVTDPSELIASEVKRGLSSRVSERSA